MVEYPIVAIMWEDHMTSISSQIPRNPDEMIETPTLTVGILLSETDKTYLVAHDVERLTDIDNGTYTVILKSTVTGIKNFGKIPLNEIRFI